MIDEMNDIQYLKSLLLVLFLSWATACEEPDVQIPEGALQEQTVDLAGEWQVVRAQANQIDITDKFDFSQIRLTLQMNGGPTDYQVDAGAAPFPVLENGSWVYDDLSYPTSVELSAANQSQVLDFAAPPISGDVSFSLSFSLGCLDNIYTYHFQKL